MPGWNQKQGDILSKDVGQDKLWSLFNYVFSDGCRKRNTYKFGLIKSLLDNLFNCCMVQDEYFISYHDLFSKFSANYWNLTVKYRLRQMRRDGRSEFSKVEQILNQAIAKNPVLVNLEFDSMTEEEKDRLVNQVSLACRKNVIGALYEDMEGLLYGFDLKGDGLYLNSCAYEFMLKYKIEIEKLNYYAWAKFLEKINDDNVLVRLIEKIELATPHREDLSIYRYILQKEFEEHNCFYCGKKLGKVIHVDHFIPWSFVKDDKIWNFVLSCPACNERKNNKIPAQEFLWKLIDRNTKRSANENQLVRYDFAQYDKNILGRMWKYAQLSGMKMFEN